MQQTVTAAPFLHGDNSVEKVLSLHLQWDSCSPGGCVCICVSIPTLPSRPGRCVPAQRGTALLKQQKNWSDFEHPLELFSC